MIVVVGFMVAMMTVIIFFNIFYANNQSMNEEINQITEEEFKKNFSDVGVKKVYYPDNADTKNATTYSTQVVDCKVKDVNLSDKRVSKTIVGDTVSLINNTDNDESDDPIKNN